MFGPRYFGSHAWGRHYFGAGTGAPPITLELEAAIAAAILADATLSALITSCSPGHIPESVTKPEVWYRVADWKRGMNLDGPDGTGICTLNLAACSLTYSEVTRIAKRINTIFNGFQGTLSGVELIGTIDVNSWDQYNDGADGSDQGTFTRVTSLNFKHRGPA